MNSNFPDIENINDTCNPCIYSKNSPTVLTLNQSSEVFEDVDTYKRFLKNAEALFRHSRSYKSIKCEVMKLGLNKCQINGNITDEMATLEMHHTILTLFDVALLISEHTLRTSGLVNTLYIAKTLKKEHKDFHVPLVILDKTNHQLYHNTNELYIPPNMVIGDWYTLLQNYRYGITKEIAYKIIDYLNLAEQEEDVAKNKILEIRENVMDWSYYNY